MTELGKRYKSTLVTVGGTMLIWALLLNVFFGGFAAIDIILELVPNKNVTEIVSSVIYDAAYLGAFMFPVAFYYLMSRGKKVEPMRFDIRLSGDSWLWIIGGVACAFAFSLLNGIMMSFVELPSSEGVIKEAAEYVSDRGLILQFITVALVPAFCEEFLFRGLVLSNIMPYGKGLAIVISSVLFGLMHGNFYQFLYTTVAGVILGLIYVRTGSIWCSVLMHMINNSLSFLQTAILERFTEETGSIIWLAVEGAVFFAGVLCVIRLVIKYGQRRPCGAQAAISTFGKLPEKGENYPMGVAAELSRRDVLRGFFNPAIIAFIVYSLFNATYVLILSQ